MDNSIQENHHFFKSLIQHLQYSYMVNIFSFNYLPLAISSDASQISRKDLNNLMLLFLLELSRAIESRDSILKRKINLSANFVTTLFFQT